MSKSITTKNEADVAYTTQGTQQQGENEGGGIAKLGLNGQIFFAQMINFLVVMIVLWRFVYKPVVRMLDERQKKIEDGVKMAESAQAKMDSVLSEQTRILDKAHQEASLLLDEARQSGEERRTILLSKAKDEVKSLVSAGKEQLRQEHEAMMQEARVQMAQIAVEAARKILEDQVDEKQANKIATKVVETMTSTYEA